MGENKLNTSPTRDSFGRFSFGQSLIARFSASKFSSLAVALALSFSLGFAQADEVPYVEGQMIVKLAPGANARAALGSPNLEIARPLVPSLGLYLVKLKNGVRVKEAQAHLASRRASGVLYSQPDHKIARRDVQMPNDGDFPKQWNLHSATDVDIDAPEAWGLFAQPSQAGTDVVVAIVDGGVDINHTDLKANIWKNQGEIPFNNLDDDGNGYVDDVNGWDAFSDSGDVPSDQHGTHCSGIASAKGNNSSMVSGVNWNAKIMAVAGATDQTSIVAAAYGYVIAQKKLWIETNGAKGANVVSTNSSFGVDYGDCSQGEFVMWNDLYNEMGKYGILSAAATANLNINIDTAGDVPTGCTSDHIVSVTNTTNTDQKNTGAAYGLKSVDLGAPGTRILSTVPGNTTTFLTGTSMATPHVAGAIAYMHSVASPAFKAFYKASPKAASLVLKRLLLGSVDIIPALKTTTVSGGRLNLYKAGLAISQYTQ